MPAQRTFVVSQTREVQISAGSLQDAIVLAGFVFDGEKLPTDRPRGYVAKDVKETDLSAREAY